MNYGNFKEQYGLPKIGTETALEIAEKLSVAFIDAISGNTTINQKFVDGVNIDSVNISPNYLKFTAEVDGSSVSIGHPTSAATTMTASSIFEYSIDNGESWSAYGVITDHSGATINLDSGNSVMFRYKNRRTHGGLQNSQVYSGNNLIFRMTGKIRADGNINSLIDRDAKCTSIGYYAFANLFYNCTALTKCPDMPATSMGTYAYYYMYRGCTSLREGPNILPAPCVPVYAYEGMFYGCTNLETGPFINADMILTSYSFRYMFYNCSKLKKLGMMIKNNPSTANTNQWLYGTTGTNVTGRTIYLASGTTWSPVSSVYGVPSNWTKIYI